MTSIYHRKSLSLSYDLPDLSLVVPIKGDVHAPRFALQGTLIPIDPLLTVIPSQAGDESLFVPAIPQKYSAL